MNSVDASASGQFNIGDITINRLGYGAMRLTGRGVWGAPSDLRGKPKVAESLIGD